MKKAISRKLKLIAVFSIMLPLAANAHKHNMQEVADILSGAILDFSTLAEALSYFTGMAYTMSAAAKFKRHVDNPQFMPLSMPITEIMIASSLFLLPVLAQQGGKLIFEQNYSDPYSEQARIEARQNTESAYPTAKPNDEELTDNNEADILAKYRFN